MKRALLHFLLLVLVVTLPTGGLLSAPPRFGERGLIMEDVSTPAPAEKKSSEKPAETEQPYQSIAFDDKAETYSPKAKSAKVSKSKKSSAKQQKKKKENQKKQPKKYFNTKQALAKTEAEMSEPVEEDEATDVSVEWVGRGRRIKRTKRIPGIIKEKQIKAPGQLIITDQYHQSIPELLQNSEQRRYGARPEESSWILSGSKFLCELRHPIPEFGYAVFKHEVGAGLQFSIESFRTTGGSGPARVQSIPPVWRHYANSKDLGVIAVKPKGRALFTVPDEWAGRLMVELMGGMVPTFSFWDETTGGDDVRLSISALNFKQHLPEFNRCLGNLLPYSFKDVRNSLIYFGYDKTGVSQTARERLKKVAEYVKLDERVKKIKVIGFSDSRGFRRYNEQLAKRRAAAVKKILLAEGIAEDKLQVLAKGERDAKHSNRTRTGRAKNRRVLVMLQK